MKEELYRFDDDDIDSIAYSVAFSEWLGIDNLQDCALTRISEEDRGNMSESLRSFAISFNMLQGGSIFHIFFYRIKRITKFNIYGYMECMHEDCTVIS